MVLTTDIATQLQTDSIGTISSAEDWGIYEANMPAAPNNCVAVFAYGGSPPPLAWEGETPNVQVRVRGSSHSATYSKAYTVLKSLHELTDTTINTTLYYHIRSIDSPSTLGRDAKGRYLYVVNFEVIKELE